MEHQLRPIRRGRRLLAQWRTGTDRPLPRSRTAGAPGRPPPTSPASQPGFAPGHWYSPNVDPDELRARAAQLWPPSPSTPGIDYRHEAQRAMVAGPLRSHRGAYGEVVEASARGPAPFVEPNDYFMGLDSRMLFTMIVQRRPARIVEVGSGFSTRLMAATVERHLRGRTSLTVVDPYPSDVVRSGFPGLGRVLAVPVQDVPLDELTQLDAGDVLFVDSSHVAKTGSDVQFLTGHVLPSLRPGVLVHLHDIFLPFDYPFEWAVEQRRDWNEQYVVQAMLASSARYEIVFSSRYASWALADDVAGAVGTGVASGQSIWLEVTRAGPASTVPG